MPTCICLAKEAAVALLLLLLLFLLLLLLFREKARRREGRRTNYFPLPLAPFAACLFASAPNFTISKKSSGFKLEPPTKNPSTSGQLARIAAFFGLTLPPY